MDPALISSSDLEVYWRGFQAAWAGLNPYDKFQVYRDIPHVLASDATPNLAWNPPYIFVLMAPWLLFSFGSCALLWLITSLSAVIVANSAYLRLTGSRLRSPLLPAFAALISWPVAFTLQVGQLDHVMLLCCVGAIAAFERKRDRTAGALMLVLLLKPQIFFLVLAYAGIIVFAERRWRVVEGGILALLALGIAAELMFPGIWLRWIFRPYWPTYLIGSTWTALLRLQYFHATGHDLPSLTLLMPGSALTLLGVALIRLRRVPPLTQALPFLLLGASMLGPYGFLFDQSVLTIVQLDYLRRRFEASETRSDLIVPCMLIILLFLSIQVLGDLALGGSQLAWYIYPPLLSVLYLCHYRAHADIEGGRVRT